MKFPAEFLWGVATASAQIEGAATADGKGESIWDRFDRKGRIQGGPGTLDRGSGHYQRWAEDVQTLAELGVGAYRFSIAWPRLFPAGRGSINRSGLDFYRRLINSLLERGIKPAVTLYHWDLPQALQEKGGWLNRDTAYRFAEYAAALFAEFGSSVPLWMTLNEPFVATVEGHMMGTHAPGLRRPFSALQAGHHLLLGHGEAVRAFRQLVPQGSRIGVANFLWRHEPATDTPADRAAAERGEGMINRWFTDPILKGHYPEEIWRWFRRRAAAPKVRPGDLEIISQPIDFLGVQYYSRMVHKARPWDLFTGIAQVDPVGVPTTDIGWQVYPDGLYKLLIDLRRQYGDLPLIITENGAAYPDQVTADGRIHDAQRIQYLQDHIRAVGRALAEGVNVQGYFVWTFLDNVEWALGTSKRFGLIHVDFETMQRRWKDSAYFYRDFIRNGADL